MGSVTSCDQVPGNWSQESNYELMSGGYQWWTGHIRSLVTSGHWSQMVTHLVTGHIWSLKKPDYWSHLVTPIILMVLLLVTPGHCSCLLYGWCYSWSHLVTGHTRSLSISHINWNWAIKLGGESVQVTGHTWWLIMPGHKSSIWSLVTLTATFNNCDQVTVRKANELHLVTPGQVE